MKKNTYQFLNDFFFYHSRYSSLSIKGSDEGGDDTFENEGGQLPPVGDEDDEVFEEGGDGKEIFRSGNV